MAPSGNSGAVVIADVAPAGMGGGGAGELYTCCGDGRSQLTKSNDTRSVAAFTRM
jgi:hypothetical protein